MTARAAAAAGDRAPAPVPDRRRAKRRAAWRRRGTVARLHEPVDRRLHGLLRLPARDERVPLVHALRPALARRAGSGSRTTTTCSTTDPQVWPAMHEHALADRVHGAAAGAVRVRHRPACSRARGAASASSARSSTCRRSRRRSRRRSASSTCSTPRPARSTRCSRKLGIQGPLWFNDPSWAKPSLVLLALWGVGNTMIIFLAAVLDVPRHLHESAELDGAGALQRLRWVTLPTISPVILFAVVLGVIEALQYFTQAYVAATSPAGRRRRPATDGATSSSATPRARRSSIPCSSTSTASASSTWATPSAMAMLLLVVAFAVTLADPAQLAPLGALPGSGAGEQREPRRAASGAVRPRGGRRRAVRRRRLLRRDRRPQPADRAAVIFLRPFVFILLTSLMTNEQALSPKLWPRPVPLAATTSTSSDRRRSGARR